MSHINKIVDLIKNKEISLAYTLIQGQNIPYNEMKTALDNLSATEQYEIACYVDGLEGVEYQIEEWYDKHFKKHRQGLEDKYGCQCDYIIGGGIYLSFVGTCKVVINTIEYTKRIQTKYTLSVDVNTLKRAITTYESINPTELINSIEKNTSIEVIRNAREYFISMGFTFWKKNILTTPKVKNSTFTYDKQNNIYSTHQVSTFHKEWSHLISSRGLNTQNDMDNEK